MKALAVFVMSLVGYAIGPLLACLPDLVQIVLVIAYVWYLVHIIGTAWKNREWAS